MTADPLIFLPLPSVDGYVLEWPQVALEMRVERLRRERSELVGELAVACALPGGKSRAGMLSVADFNLSSARARTERARVLEGRLSGLDWVDLLEELCQRVIAHERAGRPPIALRDVSKAKDADEDVTVDGVRLLRRHPVTLFGAGGDLKSLLALYWAVRLADSGLRVLFADWEFSGEDHRDRLERICGEEMPDGILYVRCERPLVHEADRLRRIVVDEKVDYVICDSIAFACDGPPESAEVAAAYFRALRRIGVGSLNLAHITKAEGGDRMPFGSAFFHNGSRATWFVKRAEETSGETVRVGLFNRKSNVGPSLPAVGYSVAFGERIEFLPTRVAEMADLAGRLPVWQRIRELLKTGSMSMVDLAGELEVDVDTVKKAVSRDKGRTFVKVPGGDGIYRIGLAV